MIRPDQSLIRTSELAKHLGVSVVTLCKRTSKPNGPWRACMLRHGWYLVTKLREAGLI